MKNNKLTAAHMTDINNIYKTVTIGMIQSENKILKTLHDSSWSVEVNQQIKHASYLRLVKFKFKTNISQ